MRRINSTKMRRIKQALILHKHFSNYFVNKEQQTFLFVAPCLGKNVPQSETWTNNRICLLLHKVNKKYLKNLPQQSVSFIGNL